MSRVSESISYFCPVCENLHVEEEMARNCCPIAHETTYICEVCGSRSVNLSSAEACCDVEALKERLNRFLQRSKDDEDAADRAIDTAERELELVAKEAKGDMNAIVDLHGRTVKDYQQIVVIRKNYKRNLAAKNDVAAGEISRKIEKAIAFKEKEV